MTNEKMFYELCTIMAGLEDVITSFEKIGFIAEPTKKGTIAEALFNSASLACDIAMALLEFPDVSIENEVCNELFSAGLDTMEEVSKKAWNQYGIKSNI